MVDAWRAALSGGGSDTLRFVLCAREVGISERRIGTALREGPLTVAHLVRVATAEQERTGGVLRPPRPFRPLRRRPRPRPRPKRRSARERGLAALAELRAIVTRMC